MSDLYDKRAELYDIAFDWDVTEEVDWLIDRLGQHCRAILEPGCGSGRMFPPFSQRGITVTGIDNSKTILDRAKERMKQKGLPEPTLYCMDMADFDLETTFDGAIMPINTFGYLPTREKAQEHLCSVARHLQKGSKYLLQVDLRSLRAPQPIPQDDVSSWERKKNGTRIKMTWGGQRFNPSTLIETQFSRIEILSGSEKGKVFEDLHPIRIWDWESWRKLISETPFVQTAAYDGNSSDRPSLMLDSNLDHARLAWHELVKSK